jgi:hypothetical protein
MSGRGALEQRFAITATYQICRYAHPLTPDPSPPKGRGESRSKGSACLSPEGAKGGRVSGLSLPLAGVRGEQI